MIPSEQNLFKTSKLKIKPYKVRINLQKIDKGGFIVVIEPTVRIKYEKSTILKIVFNRKHFQFQTKFVQTITEYKHHPCHNLHQLAPNENVEKRFSRTVYFSTHLSTHPSSPSIPFMFVVVPPRC